MNDMSPQLVRFVNIFRELEALRREVPSGAPKRAIDDALLALWPVIETLEFAGIVKVEEVPG